MTIEALEEALKDESGPYIGRALFEYWYSLYGRNDNGWTIFRNEILALIEKREKKAIALVDFCTNIEAAPRPLTLEDWKRAMENPEELKKFQRRDRKPHRFDRVIAVDLRGDYPVLVEAPDGSYGYYRIDGHHSIFQETERDLLLPPRKLKRVVRYVVEHFTPNVLGLSEPQSTYTKPVTLIYEE